jgi:nicotinamide-nucleotide amidase
MRAAILAIGDEIVGGLTTDTNSGYVAGELRAAGVEVAGGFSVPDDEDAIVRALERALHDADLAVCTGGLGPTADDLTTAAVARLAGGRCGWTRTRSPRSRRGSARAGWR